MTTYPHSEKEKCYFTEITLTLITLTLKTAPLQHTSPCADTALVFYTVSITLVSYPEAISLSLLGARATDPTFENVGVISVLSIHYHKP